MAILFCQDFFLDSAEVKKSAKCTGLFLVQKPFASDLKSGSPAAVLNPAPERNVMVSSPSMICFKVLK